MGTREMESDMFGRHVKFNYSETWVGYSLLSLRLVMGWTFFLPGVRHAWDPNWSARGLLSFAATKEGNPFQWMWAEMVEWVWLLTPLNSLGLMLVGLALLLGAFVRFSAFWGSVMMLFYWGTALPLENAFLIDDHIVYVLLLFGLGAFGSGRILGLDAKLEQLSIVEKYPRLRLLMG